MRGLRAPLVALAASITVLLLGAAPRAEAGISGATLSEPVEGATYGTPNLPVAGTFTADGGRRQVNVGVRRAVANAPTATFEITTFGGSGQFAAQTSPDFAWNGHYEVRAVFVNDDPRSGVFGGCGNDNPCTREFLRSVFLAAPPAPPADLDADFDKKTRVVTLTWGSAPEPDILGWVVTPSVDGKARPSESVPRDKGTTFEDNAVPAKGGELSYEVVAVRKGANDATTVKSEPVTKSVKVDPLPPDASTTTLAPGATTTTSSPFGPVVTAPPTSAGKARPTVPVGNLGAFAKGLNPGETRAPRATLADGTYEEELPYANPGEEVELAEEEADQVFLDTPDQESGLSAIFYVAAAALAGVVAAHVLVILRQVKRSELADAAALAAVLPVVDPAPSAASEPPATESPPRRVPRRVR